MGQLPTDQRDTLALILDDMTHAEAGDILSISEGTVSWRLSEARKHLKSLKEKEGVA
jgi:RNA polymerase sigma-70 factor (ECF subfamily)